MPRLDGENIVFGTVLSGRFHSRLSINKRGEGRNEIWKRAFRKKCEGEGNDDDANYGDDDVTMTMMMMMKMIGDDDR